VAGGKKAARWIETEHLDGVPRQPITGIAAPLSLWRRQALPGRWPMSARCGNDTKAASCSAGVNACMHLIFGQFKL